MQGSWRGHAGLISSGPARQGRLAWWEGVAGRSRVALLALRGIVTPDTGSRSRTCPPQQRSHDTAPMSGSCSRQDAASPLALLPREV